MAIASVRVQQATAAGTAPQLEHLLVDASWHATLGSEMRKPYFARLTTFLEGEWMAGHTIFPPTQCIFRY